MPSILGKRSRASSHYLLHLASSPEPCLSESDLQPRASTSKNLPILVNGTLVSHSTKKRYQCTHTGCDKAYSKPSRLEEHERSHSGQRPFVCETCGKSYLRDTHLHAHARSHLPQSDRPFSCPLSNCERDFGLHSTCVSILIGTTVQSPLFVPRRIAWRHSRNTTNYELIDGCAQSFSTSQHLRTHSKVHNEKRYGCADPVCVAANGDTIKFYPTWSALLHHNRTAHLPTCCNPSCNGRTFTSQKNLRAHQKLHEQHDAEAEIGALVDAEDVDGEPPRKKRRGGEVGRDWKCEVDGCAKDFKSKKALTTHTNVTHLRRRDHVCPQCKQMFGYKHLLQRHAAKGHATSSSSESSEEDTSCLPAPAATNRDIDTITGSAYSRTALEKLKAAKAVQCPYPHLSGLAPVQTGPPCDYVFSRAYDFRRHLQSEHNVVVDKDGVDRWLRRPGQTVTGISWDLSH
ncbi:transcription factor iiia [Mycena vitilis]|nr:transcription factor iiia [Mycena vitilis]